MFNKRVIFIQHDSPDHCEHLRHRTVRKLVQRGRKVVKTSEPVFDDVSGKWGCNHCVWFVFLHLHGTTQRTQDKIVEGKE